MKHLNTSNLINVTKKLNQTKWFDTSNEEGLTLIECIVALVVIALTIGSVTPALVIAVATRVQSQKAEQAIEVAQSEIDAVRTLMERGGYGVVDLPQAVAGLEDNPTLNPSIEDHPGPLSGTTQPTATAYAALPTNEVREVDVDGDGEVDFGIQVYRTPGEADINNLPVAFTMGVRVYDIRAVNDPAAATNLDIDEARIGNTGGDGERSRLPLAVVYTVISKGDLDESYCNYIEFLGGDPSVDYSSLGCL